MGQESQRIPKKNLTIERTLSFRSHIAEICRGAGKRLDALVRLCNVLSTEGKLTVLKTFILSQFNFGPVIGHFCSVTDITDIKITGKGSRKRIGNCF